MISRREILTLIGALLAAPGRAALPVTRQVGPVRIAADVTRSHPGGLVVVTATGIKRGPVVAVLEGRRFPFYPAGRAIRALVPVSALAPVGPATLGIEVRTARRHRYPLSIAIDPHPYPPYHEVIPEAQRPLLTDPGRGPDSRRLLRVLRTESPACQWDAPFARPVKGGEARPTFGGAATWDPGGPVEHGTDSTWGEYHRGLDFPTPAGTPVSAPAPGTVALSARLTLAGETVVINHGQGVLSALWHLSRRDVAAGDLVAREAPIGLSGATGLAPEPHVHWGIYVHAVAIDPALFEAGVA